jgi:hypothetical protein
MAKPQTSGPVEKAPADDNIGGAFSFTQNDFPRVQQETGHIIGGEQRDDLS